jgi:uncharacterized repeat protein (TIGR03806 family)
MRLILPFLASFAAAVSTTAATDAVSDIAIAQSTNPARLSEFGFFSGSPANPSPRLIAYELRTPLFTDYAIKQRFIHLPNGGQVTADIDGKLNFPVGTALVKSFGYQGANGLNVIETRLLLHKAEGWVALPYVWRPDGSDADLRVGGSRVPVTFTHQGATQRISYGVPNKNQCKQCHSAGNDIMPIGPVWQNMKFSDEREAAKLALFLGPDVKKRGSSPSWDDPKTGNIDSRARAYLNVNCGHCHAPAGSASNSGLFLDGSATSAASYGIGKRPVAAGRASVGLDFIIAPGKPDESILIARMESTDPGIAMPEVGRSTVHTEGVMLLRDWIAAMPAIRH